MSYPIVAHLRPKPLLSAAAVLAAVAGFGTHGMAADQCPCFTAQQTAQACGNSPTASYSYSKDDPTYADLYLLCGEFAVVAAARSGDTGLHGYYCQPGGLTISKDAYVQCIATITGNAN